MSEEKGLLSKELEKVIIEGLDKLISTTGIKELATDAAIRMFVPMIDNNLADKLKDSIKEPIREAGDLFLAEKYEEAIAKLADVLNVLVDVPGVDESIEEQIARKQFEVFALIIKSVIDNRKSKED